MTTLRALPAIFVAAALATGCDTATSVASRLGVGDSFEAHCEGQLPATNIEVVTLPVVYDVVRNQSYRELTQRSGSLGTPGIALGLTTAEISHKTFIDTNGIEEARGGRVCLRPTIRVELAMTPMTVHVSREVAGDPCREAVVIGHELRHVAVYEQHLVDLAGEVRTALGATYTNKVLYFRNRAEAQQQTRATLSAKIGALLGNNAQRVKERQKGVDSPEEYARVVGACGGMRVN